MVTANYWKLLGGGQYYLGTAAGTVNLGIVYTDGNTDTTYIANGEYGTKNFSFNTEMGCQLGSGTGEFSENDYTLANNITSALSSVSMSMNYEYNEGLKRQFTITGQNNESSDITIKQVGLVKYLHYGNNSASTKGALMAEINLSEPVTVPGNGGRFTINFNWTES